MAVVEFRKRWWCWCWCWCRCRAGPSAQNETTKLGAARALLHTDTTGASGRPKRRREDVGGGGGDDERSSMAINGEKLLLFGSSERREDGAIQITRSCDERPVVLELLLAAALRLSQPWTGAILLPSAGRWRFSKPAPGEKGAAAGKRAPERRAPVEQTAPPGPHQRALCSAPANNSGRRSAASLRTPGESRAPGRAGARPKRCRRPATGRVRPVQFAQQTDGAGDGRRPAPHFCSPNPRCKALPRRHSSLAAAPPPPLFQCCGTRRGQRRQPNNVLRICTREIVLSVLEFNLCKTFNTAAAICRALFANNKQLT